LTVVTGCASSVPSRPADIQVQRPLAFGRALAVLTSSSTRWYAPEVRFFELMNSTTGERIRVDIASPDELFVLSLPAGDYQLTRVQINEGPFLAMADVTATFRVNPDSVAYLGTWRFMVDSPRTHRMVVLAIAAEEDGARRQLFAHYPALTGRPLTVELPSPAMAEARLYEVMPYPRYRWFRRHP